MTHSQTKTDVIFGCIKCPLLGKGWTKFYEFNVDELYYNFTELLIDECTQLNIHPSQPFVDAMKKYLGMTQEPKPQITVKTQQINQNSDRQAYIKHLLGKSCINDLASKACFSGDLVTLQQYMAQKVPPTNILKCFLDACYVRAVEIVQYFLEFHRDRLSKDDIDAGYVLARYGPNPGDMCLNELLESYGATNRADDTTGLSTRVLFGTYDNGLCPICHPKINPENTNGSI